MWLLAVFKDKRKCYKHEFNTKCVVAIKIKKYVDFNNLKYIIDNCISILQFTIWLKQKYKHRQINNLFIFKIPA